MAPARRKRSQSPRPRIGSPDRRRTKGDGLRTHRLVALLVVLTAALALPSATSARSLSITKAKAAAQKFLDKQNADYPYEPPKKVTTCQRKNARTVDCAYKATATNGTA